MISDKMSCINGWMIKSNLVISLVPYNLAQTFHSLPKKKEKENEANRQNLKSHNSIDKNLAQQLVFSKFKKTIYVLFWFLNEKPFNTNDKLYIEAFQVS